MPEGEIVSKLFLCCSCGRDTEYNDRLCDHCRIGKPHNKERKGTYDDPFLVCDMEEEEELEDWDDYHGENTRDDA